MKQLLLAICLLIFVGCGNPAQRKFYDASDSANFWLDELSCTDWNPKTSGEYLSKGSYWTDSADRAFWKYARSLKKCNCK
jgi:hypothetical protein